MSTDLTVALQHKAKEKRDSDVTVAAIWLALYLLMVVGTLFVNRNGSVVPLALFAAVVGGWGLVGWRKKKKGTTS